MRIRLRSISFRNFVGNTLAGVAFVLLGTLRLTGIDGWAEGGTLLALIALTSTSLLANLSGKREREDEMSRFHSGRAANLALWTTLIAVSCACVIGICTKSSVDLTAACYLVTGLALATYGISFAALEQSA